MSKIKELERQMILFTDQFMTLRRKRSNARGHSEATYKDGGEVGENPSKENEAGEGNKAIGMLMDEYERFGLSPFKKDHLFQFINYLKGLQLEIEMGNFYGAKHFYMESLTRTNYINHRIRKETLQRLWSINKKIGMGHESPEKILLSRYYVKQKSVQMLLDQSSFGNTKILKSTMYLAKMLSRYMDHVD